MNDRKPRILLCNEASFLATGYSTYGMEVMGRLHATGKYELAELGCYASPGDPRIQTLPWRFYANLPGQGESADEFGAKITNQFGEYRFEEVCLDFKPDIVWDIRDYWMMEFQERSPFRKFYRWAIMPTVDASPQAEQWIATYMDADAVLTYSDWGLTTLKKEGGGLIKTVGSAPPGADLTTFVPLDKGAVRDKYGFDRSLKIVGTVMRNQPRKLYPELIEAFVEFLRIAPAALAKQTFLYLHTTYPDQGWDIPRLIKRAGIGYKCLMTYKCRECKYAFGAFYQDARATCTRCDSPNAGLTNTQMGVERTELAEIINLFDVYVQYANSEGFGMPQVEAASCGVPVMSVDYSAMSDVVRKVNGIPIPVAYYAQDPQLGCMRAVPDGTAFVNQLIKILQESPSATKERSFKARSGVERSYTWDKTAGIWMDVFNQLLSRSTKDWASPSSHFHPATQIPGHFPTNEDFVRWIILNILGDPAKLGTYMETRLIRDLNWGATTGGMARNYHNEQSLLGVSVPIQQFGPNEAIHEMKKMREHWNAWEARRCRR